MPTGAACCCSARRVSMIYAGLDQGNRLDWLESGTVMALLLGGGVLFVAFLDQRDAGSPALGACQCAVLAQCRALAGRHPALHAHQPVKFVAGAEFPQRRRPDAARTKRRPAADLWRAADVRAGADLDLSAAAFRCARRAGAGLFGFRRRQSAGVRNSPTTGRASDFVGIVLLQSIGQAFTLLPIIIMALSNSDPTRATVVCRLYPDHAARRRGDRRGADGDLAARPRADPLQLSRAVHRKRQR